MENIENENNGTKTTLYVIVAVLVVASIVFRIINHVELEQTSILFIGLPALLTLLTIKYTPTPKTAFGIVFKVVTLFLLMSAILFGEGIACILFAAPLFYGVAAILVFIYEFFKKDDDIKTYSLIVIPLILILAQPLGIKTAPQLNTISTFQTFQRNIDITELNKHPNFEINIPTLFKLGFPKPKSIRGEGIEVGDQRHIDFLSNTKGLGTLSIEVEHVTESSITFKIIEDSSHINHWLTWKKLIINIENDTENKQSTVTWTSDYTCDLGPQWYFEFVEKIAVKKMNYHLINSYFGE